jgi:hypothetical protein
MARYGFYVSPLQGSRILSCRVPGALPRAGMLQAFGLPAKQGILQFFVNNTAHHRINRSGHLPVSLPFVG